MELGPAEMTRTWDLPAKGSSGFRAEGYWLGRGDSPLEVALVVATSRPATKKVETLWKERKGSTQSPLLLVVAYAAGDAERCVACGPAGSAPAVIEDLEPGQVRRIARAALEEPDRHSAIKFLQSTLPEAPQDLPGLRNAGMFATHDLREGVPLRDDWQQACDDSKGLLDMRGKELVEGLGFNIQELPPSTSVLTAAGKKRAIAVFLDESENPEAASERFDGSTPISKGLAIADSQNLPYVVLTRGPQIRIYATDPDLGVGRKGRAETMVEANLALLPDHGAGYLSLIFGVGALASGGTFEEILDRSRDFSASLGERLRSRVYEEAVPALGQAIAARASKQPSDDELRQLYEQALFILFRLLFIAYAEDKDLLPYRSSGPYQRHALKTTARHLADLANEGEPSFDPSGKDMWSDFELLSQAIDAGNKNLDVPAYNGGLFSCDPDVSEVGAALDALNLNNAEFGPALFALLVDRDVHGTFGPVDFRSLSVREFGTIYEGLLESEMALAPSDLTVDQDGNYVPAKKSDEVFVAAGEVYLHDRSGARRETGSYFTKAFAVEHLLQQALEPVLGEHLERLQELVDKDELSQAAESFFDFRCADISMGSGHFLVAAVDRIEARLSSFLAANPLPGVLNELERLKKSALDALGEVGAGVEIEHASLLRRQVARRCIYGVDRNEIAVELARLGIWIHTFVPGLPLGFLDHSLRVGDSLTGISDVSEAEAILDAEAASGGVKSLLTFGLLEQLGEASEALSRLAKVSDASAAEITEARQAELEAEEAVAPVRDLFDVLIATRLGKTSRPEDYSPATIADYKELNEARQVCADLQSLHFPVAFPEVFLRDNPGFDCVVGNPPWEEIVVEEIRFWNSHAPGLWAMTAAKRRDAIEALKSERPDLVEAFAREADAAEEFRAALLAGPFDGMGTGDPDLYKAFTWRFWHVIRDGGSVGVVLPRTALATQGSEPWREAVFDGGSFADVTALSNNSHWVFADVEVRYTFVLVAIRKGTAHAGKVALRGPYASLKDFQNGTAAPPATFDSAEFRTWLPGAAFPLLPALESAAVFAQLRSHPSLDDRESHAWRARPISELHATNDTKEMVLDEAEELELWPVYTGASFDIWNHDTGEYFAWADPTHIQEVLKGRRRRGGANKRSAFSEMPAQWLADESVLPLLNERIAFRGITNRTNTRTVISALVPPERPLTNAAPYFLWPKGDERDQAFLLGVLCSRPLDWYARRVVESNMNLYIINSFPIPAPAREDSVRREIEQISGRLAAADERYKRWADAVGVDFGPVDEEEKQQMIRRLDALVARAYGLNADDLRHIFETFHEGWDYGQDLEATLKEFESIK
jgi:hypothetical protein